jgi:hypothetical protein
MLTREQILSAPIPRKEVEVPEWGGSVWVRALSGAERLNLSRLAESGELTGAHLVTWATVDANGARLFTDEDVTALLGTHGQVLERLAAEVLRFNVIGADGLDDAKNG